MDWLRWVVVALAVLEAGWMAFDGTRALIVGDYVTPASGPYAGRLGPWSQLVKAVGLEPRSTLMKSIFAVYGVAWLIITACFIFFNAGWTWWAMLIAAIGSLWFLPVGTLFGIIQVLLLILFQRP
jgi:hypothetical protein